jgi:hypothetical protein
VPSERLLGALAESLGRTFSFYDGFENEFIDDLLSIWCEIDGHRDTKVANFRTLYYDERFDRILDYCPLPHKRRRPKPFEAAVETCRRLVDLNRICDALRDLPTCGIVGGSASYGRFYNVCGDPTDNPSDLDLLLLLPEYESIDGVVDALKKVHGIDDISLEEMRARAQTFLHIRKELEHCIFSHKLKVWNKTADERLTQYQVPGYYVLSPHCFSWNDFDYILLKDRPVIQPDACPGFSCELWDYRDTEPTRKDNQRSFSGHDITVDREYSEVDGGWLAQNRVCHFDADRFYPGLHQNLILPQFEVRWDTPCKRLHLPLLCFRWKLQERLREEQRLRPFEIQTLSLSHARSEHFAPHTARRVDQNMWADNI